MSSSAPTFPGFPEEEMTRRFRNIIIQFKKTIKSSKNIDELNAEMEHFMNTSRRVGWPHATSGVYHKDGAEKAVAKVTTEFQRYITSLQNDPSKAVYQDLLEAVLVVESMLGQIKGR